MSTTLDQRITNSQKTTAMTCLRKHHIAYGLGIRPDTEAKPLRMGSAFHLGLEHYGKGVAGAECVSLAVKAYDGRAPESFADTEAWNDWLVEREIVARLLTGYFWRWASMDAQMTVLACELGFEIPIVNPETGRSNRNYVFAGCIDKIVILPDGRHAVMEHKTTGSDIEPTADYWQRLRIDSQISGYMLGARSKGHDVQTVLYDVARKPSIRLKQKETPEQFGERLGEDIVARPEWYFQRKEIPRIASDLAEAQADIWHSAQLIHQCEVEGRYPKNTASCIGFGRCQFFSLCTNGFDFASGEIPPGFKKVADPHVELAE